MTTPEAIRAVQVEADRDVASGGPVRFWIVTVDEPGEDLWIDDSLYITAEAAWRSVFRFRFDEAKDIGDEPAPLTWTRTAEGVTAQDSPLDRTWTIRALTLETPR